ncbi:anti-repressor SinI family protein [Peribacillus frigoritolerans]|nr:anti-repressor SinI family protein [Peribacillus frigoritolerans]
MEANNEREEWVYLILEAKNLGLSIEDVREFIFGNRDKKLIMG